MVNARAVAAEFLATALFVWSGCGAAVSSFKWVGGGTTDPGALISIAIAFGFTISVLAYGIGHISGGHINPAVTTAMMALGEIDIVSGIVYIVAQCIGAIFGALILWGCVTSLTDNCADTPDSNLCATSLVGDKYGPAFQLGANSLGDDVSQGCAFLLELVGTYLLVITVLNSAVHKGSAAGNAAPIAIGWSVMLAHIVLIPYTGCGINPARSLGPMIVDLFGGVNVWKRGVWVFYTAPFVGGLLAAATYKFIFEEPEEADPKKDDDAEVAEEQA
eukprot:CAMPEP_0172394686 /NCGR_PEP_ID=MMETSP1061-20121228/16040_1 /TAXON_ID=37318 /ORGANISM="Pseudo-nitzschia pungens, Strain cf. pungens" /LENGTH=274 /DNA_ID=CAMNT_0013126109 /DNA_START=168 /DNA_END=992 /DNA_ORIENTATION=+